ncbi:MAG: hypothetical protein AAGC60_01895 [Acidobacteriota bacterium]
MSAVAIVTMIVICGSVWGGFIALLAYALRREATKSDTPSVDPGS